MLKTLATSKITHLFITLPDPPDTFMHDLNVCFFFLQFLWDSKRSKVSKSVECKPYEDGGMNTLDVFKFLSAMKILWLRKISSEEFSQKTFLPSIYPDLDNFRIYGSEYANVLMVKIFKKILFGRCCKTLKEALPQMLPFEYC